MTTKFILPILVLLTPLLLLGGVVRAQSGLDIRRLLDHGYLALGNMSNSHASHAYLKIDKTVALHFSKPDGSDTVLYKTYISVAMRSLKKDSVYLPEYGVITKDTSVSFLTGSRLINIYNTKNEMLKSLALQDITFLESATSMSLPADSDFSSTVFREELISKDTSFEEQTRSVLNHYFPTGISRNAQDGKVILTTPYYDLALPPTTTKSGQTAFKLVYTYNNGSRKFYHLYTSERQRRRGERGWTAVDDATISSKAVELLNKLINDLKQ